MSRRTVIECTCDWKDCRAIWHHSPLERLATVSIVEPTTGTELDLCTDHYRKLSDLSRRDLSAGALVGMLKPGVIATPSSVARSS